MSRELVPSTLGLRLHLARVTAGYEQRELGAAARVSPNTLSQLENGRQRQLRTSALRRLARSLGVTADYLLGMDLAESEVVDQRDPRNTGTA